MFERLFAGSDLLDWPIASMIFFIVFFVAVILRVYSKKRANLYEHMAHLPLEDRPLEDLLTADEVSDDAAPNMETQA